MTTIYLIRHAQADSSVLDQQSRPLTDEGVQDGFLIAKNFVTKKLDVIFSSPYKRTLYTVLPLAIQHNLAINIIEDLRGLRLQSNWIDSYRTFFLKYWNDFDYHYSDGESFAQLQSRCVDALSAILCENANKTIVICSHSVAIAVIIKFYITSFSFEDFMQIAENEPHIIKMKFDASGCSYENLSR